MKMARANYGGNSPRPSLRVVAGGEPGERHRGGGPARPAALASLRAGVRHEGYSGRTVVNHKGSD